MLNLKKGLNVVLLCGYCGTASIEKLLTLGNITCTCCGSDQLELIDSVADKKETDKENDSITLSYLDLSYFAEFENHAFTYHKSSASRASEQDKAKHMKFLANHFKVCNALFDKDNQGYNYDDYLIKYVMSLPYDTYLYKSDFEAS